MNPQTNPKTPEKPARYEPRDPNFYMLARCMLSAALVPATSSPQYHSADHVDAEETARKAAQLLDGGGPPDTFTQRAIARRMAEVREYAATVGAIVDARNNPMGTPLSIRTQAEVQRAREKEALREKEEGPMPTLDALKAQNEKDLALFCDLSEPVRDAALRASALRLRGTTEITGARPEEAIGIVCEEISRALRFAKEDDIATTGLPEDAGLPDIANGCAYPANLAAFALIGAMGESEDDAPKTVKPSEGP